MAEIIIIDPAELGAVIAEEWRSWDEDRAAKEVLSCLVNRISAYSTRSGSEDGFAWSKAFVESFADNT